MSDIFLALGLLQAMKVIVLNLFLGLLAAIALSNRRIINTTYAMLQLKSGSKSLFTGNTPTSQEIHIFFLKRGILIPIEDIFTSEEGNSFLGMRKACRKGKIHFWIPLKLRIPIFGEKVIEWCMSLP